VQLEFHQLDRRWEHLQARHPARLRRLALVELLPEAIQQHVREGRIPAHVAMKFLVPVAHVR
jgi:hypothetical protein